MVKESSKILQISRYAKTTGKINERHFLIPSLQTEKSKLAQSHFVKQLYENGRNLHLKQGTLIEGESSHDLPIKLASFAKELVMFAIIKELI